MIITLPNFNPNFIEIGKLSIRYYSLAYILGIIFTWWFVANANRRHHLMKSEAIEAWLNWAVLSIIIGGRVGYVLFYNPLYFLSNPLEIFAIWQGGMSFHGGLYGSIIGMMLFCKKYKVNFFKLTDVIAVISPIGLFFGRISNFINMELYGRATNFDYGVIFPNVDNLPRHPSQLYEAFFEGLLMFFILFFLYKKTNIKNIEGRLSGLFLMLYGLFRCLVENFREPDYQLGTFFDVFTMGQILSIPIMAIGLMVFFKGYQIKFYNAK